MDLTPSLPLQPSLRARPAVLARLDLCATTLHPDDAELWDLGPVVELDLWPVVDDTRPPE